MPPNSEGDEHLLELVRSELCGPIGSGALRGGVSRIKRIAATNTSNDYFMGKELNAVLGFKKVLQKFSWDTMKYIRFVTEWGTGRRSPLKGGHLFILLRGEPAVADGHHEEPGESRHERGAGRTTTAVYTPSLK